MPILRFSWRPRTALRLLCRTPRSEGLRTPPSHGDDADRPPPGFPHRRNRTGRCTILRSVVSGSLEQAVIRLARVPARAGRARKGVPFWKALEGIGVYCPSALRVCGYRVGRRFGSRWRVSGYTRNRPKVSRTPDDTYYTYTHPNSSVTSVEVTTD